MFICMVNLVLWQNIRVDHLSIANHNVRSIPPTDTNRIVVGVLIIFYYLSQIQFPSDNYCTYQLKNCSLFNTNVLYVQYQYCIEIKSNSPMWLPTVKDVGIYQVQIPNICILIFSPVLNLGLQTIVFQAWLKI